MRGACADRWLSLVFPTAHTRKIQALSWSTQTFEGALVVRLGRALMLDHDSYRPVNYFRRSLSRQRRYVWWVSLTCSGGTDRSNSTLTCTTTRMESWMTPVMLPVLSLCELSEGRLGHRIGIKPHARRAELCKGAQRQ
jgi:hypothetical protein